MSKGTTKVLHRKTFQNSNNIVELTVKTIPKDCYKQETQPKKEFVRDCALKKELKRLSGKENNNVLDKPPVPTAKPKDTSSRFTVQVSKKGRERQHEVLAKNNTWADALRDYSSIASCDETNVLDPGALSRQARGKNIPIRDQISNQRNFNSSDSNQSNTSELIVNRQIPSGETSQEFLPQRMNVEGGQVHTRARERSSSGSRRRDRVPPTIGGIRERSQNDNIPKAAVLQRQPNQGMEQSNDNRVPGTNNRLLSDDVNSSPFGESALHLLHQLRTKLQSRGDSEGMDIVGAVEAFITGQGSIGGVCAGNPPPSASTVSPAMGSVFPTPPVDVPSSTRNVQGSANLNHHDRPTMPVHFQYPNAQQQDKAYQSHAPHEYYHQVLQPSRHPPPQVSQQSSQPHLQVSQPASHPSPQISQPPSTHPQVSQPPSTHPQVSQPTSTHPQVSQPPFTHPQVSQHPPIHSQVSQPPSTQPHPYPGYYQQFSQPSSVSTQSTYCHRQQPMSYQQSLQASAIPVQNFQTQQEPNKESKTLHGVDYLESCKEQDTQKQEDIDFFQREIAKQKKIISSQKDDILQLRTLSTRLLAMQEQLTLRNREVRLNDDQRSRNDSLNGTAQKRSQRNQECQTDDTRHENPTRDKDIETPSSDRDYRSTLLSLETENDTLRKELRRLREITMDLQNQLAKAYADLDSERQSHSQFSSGLSSSKFSGSAPNLEVVDRTLRENIPERLASSKAPSNQGESEVDSAYEEKTSSRLTSKVGSPHWDNNGHQQDIVTKSVALNSRAQDPASGMQHLNIARGQYELPQESHRADLYSRNTTVPRNMTSTDQVPVVNSSFHSIEMYNSGNMSQRSNSRANIQEGQNHSKVNSQKNRSRDNVHARQDNGSSDSESHKSYDCNPVGPTSNIIIKNAMLISDNELHRGIILEDPAYPSFSTVSEESHAEASSNQNSFLQEISFPKSTLSSKVISRESDRNQVIHSAHEINSPPMESTRVHQESPPQADSRMSSSDPSFIPLKGTNTFTSLLSTVEELQ